MINHNYSALFPIILITVLTLVRSQFLSVKPVTTTINVNSTYTFTIIDSNFNSKSGTVNIYFNSTYFSLSGTYPCAQSSGTTSYTCTATSTSIISFPFTSTGGKQSIEMTIQNIKNPSIVTSFSFAYIWVPTSGSNSTYTSTYDGYTTAQLTSCSIVMSPTTVNIVGEMQFTLTLNNQVGNSGGISLTFPTSWTYSKNSSAQPISSTSTQTYRKITGTTIVSSLTPTVATGTQSIQLSSLFNATTAGGTSISFGISGILSPATTYDGNTVTVTTLNSNFNKIDQSSCSVTGITAQSITISTASSFTVGVSTTLITTWTTASTLTTNDTITITLPDSMSWSLSNSFSLMQYGSSNTKSVMVISSGSTTNQKILTMNETVTLIPTDSISFNITSIIPQINSASRSITYTVKRSGYSIASGTLSITVGANSLTGTTISSTNAIVSSTGNLTISFILTNPLATSASIKITFPSSLTSLPTTPICNVTSSNNYSLLASSSTCSFSSKVLKIQNFLINTLPALANLAITVASIGNPNTVASTDAFLIYTYYNSSLTTNVVDQSIDTKYTATSASITTASVTHAGSNIVGQYTPYTINYQIKSYLPSNAFIVLGIPSQLSLSTSPAYTMSINGATASLFTPGVDTTTSSSYKYLNFTNLFSTDKASGNNLTFVITNLRNPLSLKPTSSFVIYSYSGSYSLLQQSITSGLTVSVTTMNSFSAIYIDVATRINSKSTIYTFVLQPSITLSINDKLILTLGTGSNQISYDSTVTCTAGGVSATVVKLNMQLTITLGTQLTSGSVYQIVITSLILGRTFAQSPNMIMIAQTSLGYGVSTATLTPPVNNQANYLTSLTISIQQNPSKLNQLQSFMISFNVTTPLTSTDYAIIQIPTNSYQFTQSSIRTTSICSNSNYNCSMLSNNSFKLTSTGFSNTTTVSLTLIDAFYRSPITFSFSTNDYFIVKTYDSSGGIMDTTDTTLAATQAAFTLTCAKYCKTCKSTNTSYCTACYQINETDGYEANVTYDNYNYITSDGQCVTTCGDGYYNSSNTCIACNAPCKYCSNATACTSCITNYSLTTTKQCLSQCPNGTYSSSGVCSDCGGLCVTCVNTSVTCTFCKTGYVLNNSICISSCPDGTYVSNSICYSCDTSCVTCTTNSTNCQACKTGYYNTSTSGPGLCVNFCPTGTVNYTNTTTGTWTCGCAAQCLTCSSTSSTCNSCNSSGLFPYYNSASNTCSSTCSTGTYLNGSQCVVCPQKNCAACDTTGCTLCENSSTTPYLKSGACVSSCPQTTTLQNVSCVSCPSGCKICASTTSCTTCLSSYLMQAESCVTNCSTSYINFNASVCLKQCPSGYTNQSNKCQLSTSNSTTNSTSNSTSNSTAQTTTQTLTSSKIVPFPIIIGYIVIWAVVIASRVAIQSTIVPCGAVAFGCIMQIGSWFTLLIVFIILQGFSFVPIILFLAILFNFILNIISLVFLIKYTEADPLANKHSTKCSISNKIIKGISLFTMHKFLQLQFSCLFGLRIFSSKVINVSVFTPLNILLYISILPSILAIVAGGIASYQVQDEKLNSPVFIEALDCIIVTVLNLIVTVWATIRRPDQYQDSMDNAKFYDTTDQLIGKQNQVGIIEQPFLQESGNKQDPYRLKSKINGKTYYYNSSRKVGNSQQDKQAPLSKRNKPRLPVGTNDDLPQINQEKSSDALVIDRSNNGRRRISSDQFQGGQTDFDKLDANRNGRQDNLNNSIARSLKSPAKTVKNQGMYQNEIASPKQIQKMKEMKEQKIQILKKQMMDEKSEKFKALSPQQQEKQRQMNQELQNEIQRLQNEDIIENNSIYSKATSPMRAMKKKNEKFQGLQDQLNRSVEEIKLSPMRKMEAVAELNHILKDRHSSQIPQNSDDTKNRKDKKSLSKNKSPKNKSPNKGKSKGKSPKKNDKGNQSGVNADEQVSDNQLKRVTSHQDLKKKNAKVKKPKDTQSHAKMKNNRASINRSQDLQIIFQQNPNFQRTDPQDYFDEEQVPSIPLFHPKNQKYNKNISPADMQIVQFPQRSKASSDKQLQKDSKSLDKHGIQSPKKSKQFNGQDLKQFRATENISSLSKKQIKNLKSSENLRDSSFFDRTKIINDQLQSLNSQEDMIFNNVSPSQFDVANQRFYDGDQISDMPEKPMIKNIITKQQDNQIISTVRDRDIIIGDSPIQPYMNRYISSQQLDYDSMLKQNINNQRIKDLQKIYLPRLEVKKSLDKRR